MQPCLWERIKIWFCENFEHKFDKSKAWVFNGHRHNTCKRCRRVISTTLEND